MPEALTLEQKLQVKDTCIQLAKELVFTDPLMGTISANIIAQKVTDIAKILEKYFYEEK